MINELASVQNFGSNSSNLSFGEFEDITNEINENLTNVAPFPNTKKMRMDFYMILLNPWKFTLFQVNVDSSCQSIRIFLSRKY